MDQGLTRGYYGVEELHGCQRKEAVEPHYCTSRARSRANSASLIDPTELFDFICNAEAHYAPEFIARLPRLLHVTLCQASSLKDQVCKHGNEW